MAAMRVSVPGDVAGLRAGLIYLVIARNDPSLVIPAR